MVPCEWCPKRHNSVRHRSFPLSETGQSGDVVLIRESENRRQSDHSGRKLQHDNYTGPWRVTEDLQTDVGLQVTNAR